MVNHGRMIVPYLPDRLVTNLLIGKEAGLVQRWWVPVPVQVFIESYMLQLYNTDISKFYLGIAWLNPSY